MYLLETRKSYIWKLTKSVLDIPRKREEDMKLNFVSGITWTKYPLKYSSYYKNT